MLWSLCGIWGCKTGPNSGRSPAPEPVKVPDPSVGFRDEEFDLEVGSKTVRLNLKLDQILHSSYTLFGHASKVFGASSNENLVTKISWPETSRENEAIVTTEARKKKKGNQHILEHLPTVICTAGFEGTLLNRHLYPWPVYG